MTEQSDNVYYLSRNFGTIMEVVNQVHPQQILIKESEDKKKFNCYVKNEQSKAILEKLLSKTKSDSSTIIKKRCNHVFSKANKTKKVGDLCTNVALNCKDQCGVHQPKNPMKQKLVLPDEQRCVKNNQNGVRCSKSRKEGLDSCIYHSNNTEVAKHKKDGMINIKKKTCQEDGCDIEPTFNYNNIKPGIYCVKHKKYGMNDVKHNTCCITGCAKRAHYFDENKNGYCPVHKNEKEDMIGPKRKNCIVDNCETRPSFNFEGLEPQYCNQHKLNGMYNLVKKNCIVYGCKISATYNIKNKKAQYCVVHKNSEMINVNSKTCKEINCNVQPRFNYPNEKNALYCNTHKLNGMQNIISKKCENDECNILACYNIKGEKKPKYCKLHKSYEMVDIVTKTCKSEWCDVRANKKFKNYCCRCYVFLFPNEPISKNFKTKEKSVTDFLQEKFPNLNWFFDKLAPNAISKRRPDAVVDLGSKILIVEIDENQHKNYDCVCENKRLMEISVDYQHKPIIFIRFNPDQYIDDKGQKIKSCWSNNKLGICQIFKKDEEKWNARLTSLKNCISYWSDINNNTNKTIEIIQLYFDMCSSE